mmetsp:Transcript_91358/g.144391  ORF Transcript_91358/g.144391 Transcript_91358/m.144391 type:complete len:201 (-) Transcript_91358:1248-1850(-)
MQPRKINMHHSKCEHSNIRMPQLQTMSSSGLRHGILHMTLVIFGQSHLWRPQRRQHYRQSARLRTRILVASCPCHGALRMILETLDLSLREHHQRAQRMRRRDLSIRMRWIGETRSNKSLWKFLERFNKSLSKLSKNIIRYARYRYRETRFSMVWILVRTSRFARKIADRASIYQMCQTTSVKAKKNCMKILKAMTTNKN